MNFTEILNPTINIDIDELIYDTTKDYVSDIGVDYIVKDAMPRLLDVSVKELKYLYDMLDGIGDVTTCTIEQDLKLMKEGAFTSQNITNIHNYCSIKGMLDKIPTEKYGSLMVKNFLIQKLEPVINVNSVDTSIIEKIHVKIEYINFLGSHVFSWPYQAFHWFFNKPVTNVMNELIIMPKNIMDTFYLSNSNIDNELNDFNNNSLLSYYNNNDNHVVLDIQIYNSMNEYFQSQQSQQLPSNISDDNNVDDNNTKSNDESFSLNQKELVVLSDMVSMVNLMRYGQLTFKMFLCYYAEIYNDLFTTNSILQHSIDFMIQAIMSGKVELIKIVGFISDFIISNPFLKTFINTFNDIIHHVNFGDILARAGISVISYFRPIIGQILFVYNMITSLLDKFHVRTIHASGLDIQVSVKESFRLVGHNRFTAKLVSEIFNIDITVSDKCHNEKEILEQIIKKFNELFEVNAFVCTGIYYALFNKDDPPIVGLYNKIAFKFFVEDLMNHWIDANNLTPEEREFYLAYLKSTTKYEVNFLDYLMYFYKLVTKSKNNDNKLSFPKDDNKKEANYWDLYKNEDPFTFFYHLIFGTKPPVTLGDDSDDKFNKLIIGHNKSRTNEQTNELEDFQDKGRSDYEGHTGKYSRTNIILRENMEILYNDISMGLFVNNVFTSFSSLFINTFFLNEDEKEKYQRKDYYQLKCKEFKNIYTQSYLTRVLATHTSVSLGMLPFADKWSDEFFNDIFAPNIAILCSFGVSSFMIKTEGDEHFKIKMGNILINSIKTNSYTISKSIYNIIHAKSLIKGAHIIWAKIIKVIDIIYANIVKINTYFCFNVISSALTIVSLISTNKLIKYWFLSNNNSLENYIQQMIIENLNRKQKQLEYAKYLYNKSNDLYGDLYEKECAVKQIEENNYYNNDFIPDYEFISDCEFQCIY